MTLSFPLTLTERFALIVRALHAAVAARIKCPPVTAGIIVFVCARLRRFLSEFERLAVQIRAGTYVERRHGKRRAGGAGSRRGASIVMLHWNLGLPPWQPAWLHRVAPGDAGVWAEALRNLVSDPDMAAVISVVPRMRRILQPLCFMLGVETRLLRSRVPPAPPAPKIAVMDGGRNLVPPTLPVAVPSASIAVADTPSVDARPAAARCEAPSSGAIFPTA